MANKVNSVLNVTLSNTLKTGFMIFVGYLKTCAGPQGLLIRSFRRRLRLEESLFSIDGNLAVTPLTISDPFRHLCNPKLS